MAKRKTPAAKTDAAPKNARSTDDKKTASSDENRSQYWRKVFSQNPKLLKGRSNKALFEQWLTDHPGETEVPPQVKSSLFNIKSTLRSKKRKRRGRQEDDNAPVSETQWSPVAETELETLEQQIDEALSLARHLDRDGLVKVIVLLRSARNEVVRRLGE